MQAYGNVRVRTGGGNATPGLDYVELVTVLDWAAGETGIKTASVEILEDRDEWARVRLHNGRDVWLRASTVTRIGE